MPTRLRAGSVVDTLFVVPRLCAERLCAGFVTVLLVGVSPSLHAHVFSHATTRPGAPGKIACEALFGSRRVSNVPSMVSCHLSATIIICFLVILARLLCLTKVFDNRTMYKPSIISKRSVTTTMCRPSMISMRSVTTTGDCSFARERTLALKE